MFAIYAAVTEIKLNSSFAIVVFHFSGISVSGYPLIDFAAVASDGLHA